MPHLRPDGKVAVFRSEVCPNFLSISCFEKRVSPTRFSKNKIGTLQRACYGTPAEYDFDTLEPHVKKALGDPREEKHPLEKHFKYDKEAIRFFQHYRFDDGTYLDIDCQNRYIINASVLRAIMIFEADLERENKKKGKANKGIYGALCQHAITFNNALTTKHKYGHTLPASEKRFKEVLKAFEKNGYQSLISAKHRNANSRKVDEATIGLLESLFAKDPTKPNPTEVHRLYSQFLTGTLEIINNETGECYSPLDFNILSDSTVKTYLTQWKSRIATHFDRSGDRQQYMQAYKTPHKLEKPHFAGSLISIDDRQPPFKMHDGKRIWAYMAIDLGSEAFTCWVFGKSKEGIIKEFYQELIVKYHQWGVNLPDGLEAESSLNASFTETFLREGAMFQNVRIEANNARGKKIERYFRDLRYKHEKQREGWLARPHAVSESNQPGSHNVPALTYNEIVDGCLRDIQDWNNEPHSVHTHLSRWEVFEQTQNPNLQPTNYIGILPHLGRKTPTSCNVGTIRLNRSEFLLGENGEIVFGEKLVSFMVRVEGRDVDVYWLDDSNHKVFKALVYIGTMLICEAIPKPSYPRAVIERTPGDEYNRELMSKYVATVEAYRKSKSRAIEAVTCIDITPARPKRFIMPGLKQYEVDQNAAVEILPEPDNEFDYQPTQSFIRPLKDRF